jgi:general stress protein YciG
MANKQNEKQSTSNRGFAAMDERQQREIAKKGGEAVSRNREHMAEIGKKGGEAVSANRQHMSEIGQKGGESRRKSR